MKTKLAFFTFILAGLISCSKGANQKNTDSKTTEQTEFNINGTYTTDFGDLQLTESSKKVTGSYSYPGDGGINVTGTLKGDLNDKAVSFSWEQKQGEQSSGGNGTFTFSADAKSFTGSWTDSKGGTGPWNGTKK